MSLRTVAIMLPMFMMAMQVGGVSIGDVMLEQVLAAVPDLDALVLTLGGEEGPTTGAAAVPSWRTITCSDVGYRYPGQERNALDHLELTLGSDESLAVVGLNGADKTTLVTLLSRLRDPSSGTITVDGIDLRTIDPRAWQRQMAVVYQDFTRYPFTLRENVALVDIDGDVDEAALAHATEMAGLTAVIDRLPHGWETVLAPGYRRGADVSGGQWQRIALARALYAVARGARLLAHIDKLRGGGDASELRQSRQGPGRVDTNVKAVRGDKLGEGGSRPATCGGRGKHQPSGDTHQDHDRQPRAPSVA